MGFFDKLFGRISETGETDDEREIREYEEYYTPDTGVTDSTYSEFLVDDIFFIAGRGTVVTGTVQSGSFRVGDKISVESGSAQNIVSEILAIEKFRKMCPKVSEGENAGLLLKGIEKGMIKTNSYIKKI